MWIVSILVWDMKKIRTDLTVLISFILAWLTTIENVITVIKQELTTYNY